MYGSTTSRKYISADPGLAESGGPSPVRMRRNWKGSLPLAPSRDVRHLAPRNWVEIAPLSATLRTPGGGMSCQLTTAPKGKGWRTNQQAQAGFLLKTRRTSSGRVQGRAAYKGCVHVARSNRKHGAFIAGPDCTESLPPLLATT